MNKQKRPGTEAHCSCRRHTRQGKRRRGKTRSSSRGIQDMSPGGIKLSSKAFSTIIICQICQALSLKFPLTKAEPFLPFPGPFRCLPAIQQILFFQNNTYNNQIRLVFLQLYIYPLQLKIIIIAFVFIDFGELCVHDS